MLQSVAFLSYHGCVMLFIAYSFLHPSLLPLIGETVIWGLIPSSGKISTWVSKVKASPTTPSGMLLFVLEKIGIGNI